MLDNFYYLSEYCLHLSVGSIAIESYVLLDTWHNGYRRLVNRFPLKSILVLLTTRSIYICVCVRERETER